MDTIWGIGYGSVTSTIGKRVKKRSNILFIDNVLKYIQHLYWTLLLQKITKCMSMLFLIFDISTYKSLFATGPKYDDGNKAWVSDQQALLGIRAATQVNT